MTASPEDIETKVKAIAKRNPVYSEVAKFVGDLISATVQASDNFCPPELSLDLAQLPDAWSQGKSFLDPGELSLDWKQARALYKQLVELVKESKDGPRQVEGLMQVLPEDEDSTPKLMQAALTSDIEAIETAARELAVDPPVLTLLLRLSMRPALLEVARAAQNLLDLSQWNHGHCPVCGSAPKLADLSGEGGQRTLHCSLCETAWPYVRLQCPFCENDNSDDLSYLRAESEEGLRVDLCSRCGQYLKTIDLRELSGPIIVPLDDMATYHLDLIAQEKLADNTAGKSRAI
jgi:FdhE protein